MIANAGQKVIDAENNGQGETAGKITFAQCKIKGNAVYLPWGFLQQSLALLSSMFGQFDIT